MLVGLSHASPHRTGAIQLKARISSTCSSIGRSCRNHRVSNGFRHAHLLTGPSKSFLWELTITINPESFSMAARVVFTSIAFSIVVLSRPANQFDESPVSISGGREMGTLTRMEPLQSVDERVNEIEKWYAEALKLGVKNASSIRWSRRKGCRRRTSSRSTRR